MVSKHLASALESSTGELDGSWLVSNDFTDPRFISSVCSFPRNIIVACKHQIIDQLAKIHIELPSQIHHKQNIILPRLVKVEHILYNSNKEPLLFSSFGTWKDECKSNNYVDNCSYVAFRTSIVISTFSRP